MKVVTCTVADVKDACLLVGLVFKDIVLGFSVLDVVFVVGVIVVITVDDV